MQLLVYCGSSALFIIVASVLPSEVENVTIPALS